MNVWNWHVTIVVVFAVAGVALVPIVPPMAKRPTLQLAVSQRATNALPDYVHLDQIDRVLVISDLHVDHAENMQWLTNRTTQSSSSSSSSAQDGKIILTHSDLLVVAGDISHEHDRIEQSLQCLVQTGASVLFVVGNHEAWLSSKQQQQLEPERSSLRSSMEKLDAIYETCRRLGVYSQTCLKVGGTATRPHTLWLVPMESWYDGSLSLTECEDLCHDFGSWPWVDFIKCQWSSEGFEEMKSPNQRIPQGLSHYFATLNEPLLQALPQWISDPTRNNDGKTTAATATMTVEGKSTIAIMTISHFLPNQQCLPDWKDIHSPTFQRSLWLEHGGGGVSAKFAKVAGTSLLDQQIRSIQLPTHVRRMHVFGHSHRPKDFEFQGIRYIHNPLGKPREREIFMVSPNADFQEVWKTKDKGEVVGNQVIRFWEEQGGGLEALKRRMEKSKKTNRYGKYSTKRTEPRGNATKVTAG